MKNNEFDILDIFLILAKRKAFIFITTLIVSILAVIYSLITPQYWVSSATILPSSEDRINSTYNSSILGIGSSLLGSSMQNSSIDMITIMNSRTFSEDVITHFNLIEYFNIQHPEPRVTMELSIENLNNNVKQINFNDETGIIRINIETKDKLLSSKMANYYWQKLEEFNIESRMNTGKRKRLFLEKRLTELQTNIDSLIININNFQKDNAIIDLEEQTKSVIGLYSELNAQKIGIEIELELLKHLSDIRSPKNKELQTKLNIINAKILELEHNEYHPQIRYRINIDDIPDMSMQYLILNADYELQKKLYEFLYPQYEQAKIEEIKDLPTIDVIDEAVPAGLRSKPKRVRLCIIACLLAFVLSSTIIYTFEKMKITGRDKKINEILKILINFKKIDE
jgi:uncharacterized protein involved in exopolysaccharide biosynthesis